LVKVAFVERGADHLLLMRKEHGNVAPALISKGEDVGEVRVDVPYQLITILETIYSWVPKGNIAVITRRCDEKALAELTKRGYIDEKRIIKVGLACSKEQIAKCRCSDPVPSKVDIGEPNEPAPADDLSERLAKMSAEERLKFWVRQFRKCNKCFACTHNCPVCFCDDCVLEERTFVSEQGIPPGLSFHMIRSFHMIDKCIECGECERSCPAEIPLLTMRKMLAKDMKEVYGFLPGDPKTVSPLNTTLEGETMEDECNEC
jgi:ferredoxin